MNAPPYESETAPKPPVPTTIIIQAPTGPRRYENYNSKASNALGIAQIVIGLSSIFCWSMAMVFEMKYQNYYLIPFIVTGLGIWCGVFVSAQIWLFLE